MTRAIGAVLFALSLSSPVSAQAVGSNEPSRLELGVSFNYLLIGGSALENLHSGLGGEALAGYNVSSTFGVDARVAVTDHEQTLFIIGEDPGHELLFRVGLEPRLRSHSVGGESTGYVAARVGYVAPRRSRIQVSNLAVGSDWALRSVVRSSSSPR